MLAHLCNKISRRNALQTKLLGLRCLSDRKPIATIVIIIPSRRDSCSYLYALSVYQTFHPPSSASCFEWSVKSFYINSVYVANVLSTVQYIGRCSSICTLQSDIDVFLYVLVNYSTSTSGLFSQKPRNNICP
jgi:hypothetical protein